AAPADVPDVDGLEKDLVVARLHLLEDGVEIPGVDVHGVVRGVARDVGLDHVGGEGRGEVKIDLETVAHVAASVEGQRVGRLQAAEQDVLEWMYLAVGQDLVGQDRVSLAVRPEVEKVGKARRAFHIDAHRAEVLVKRHRGGVQLQSGKVGE